MNFTVQAKDLATAASFASSSIPSTKDILNHFGFFFLKTEDHAISITTYNGKQWSRVLVPADIVKHGEVAVPPATLLAVAKATSQEVSVRQSGANIILNTEGFHVEAPYALKKPPDDLTTETRPPNAKLTLPGPSLRNLLLGMRIPSNTNDAHAEVQGLSTQGILLEFDNELLHATAGNSTRGVCATAHASYEAPPSVSSVFLPPPLALTLLKLPKDDTATLTAHKDLFRVSTHTIDIVSPYAEGKPPPWRKIIESVDAWQSRRAITAPANILHQAAARAAFAIDEEGDGLSITIEEQTLILEGDSSRCHARAEAHLDSVAGDDTGMHRVGGKPLIDSLANYGNNDVTIILGPQLSPLLALHGEVGGVRYRSLIATRLPNR